MRRLVPHILKDLQKKMVFIAGPRQCGKTTLAQEILAKHFSSGVYYNWDDDEHRKAILERAWGDDEPLVVLDEIHKYPRWKNWIKGIYDTEKSRHRFLVTGSARLDVYRRGGDSLLGRYHLWHLHPFTFGDLPEKMKPQEALRRFMFVGGFPEPFLDGDETAARRWRKERMERVLKDDLRDLESIREIVTLELLVDALRRRVGGMIVFNNLAQDLHVAQPTIQRWIEALERMYVIFSVRPFSKNLPRMIQKPPKIYFYDNADVIGDEGARFENLVASHLLQHIQFLEDSTGYRYELRYLRDKEKREVDFLILKDSEVFALVEAKWSDTQISSHLLYYAERLKPKFVWQIVGQIKKPYSKGKIKVLSAAEAFSKTPHPAFG